MVCLLVLYVPILILMVFSLNSGNIVTHWEGISLHWYGVALANDDFYEAAQNTMIIAVSATLISTTVSTLAALGMTRVRPWRGLDAPRSWC